MLSLDSILSALFWIFAGIYAGGLILGGYLGNPPWIVLTRLAVAVLALLTALLGGLYSMSKEKKVIDTSS
jgi:hypothetical protein